MRVGRMNLSVGVENPSSGTPDGDGGYTQVWTALVPSPVWASIAPATAHALERQVASTIEAKISHLVRMRFHPQITTATRLTYDGRILNVRGVQNVDEQSVELLLACEEVTA